MQNAQYTQFQVLYSCGYRKHLKAMEMLKMVMMVKLPCRWQWVSFI